MLYPPICYIVKGYNAIRISTTETFPEGIAKTKTYNLKEENEIIVLRKFNSIEEAKKYKKDFKKTFNHSNLLSNNLIKLENEKFQITTSLSEFIFSEQHKMSEDEKEMMKIGNNNLKNVKINQIEKKIPIDGKYNYYNFNIKQWEYKNDRKAGDFFSEDHLITPEFAKEVLETRNAINRPLNKRRVDDYCNDMKSGKWFPNTDSIGFDFAGNLNNHQHVLTAIEKCGIPQKMTVKFNLPLESFEFIDSGRVRSLYDSCKSAGINAKREYISGINYYFKRNGISTDTKLVQECLPIIQTINLKDRTQPYWAAFLAAKIFYKDKKDELNKIGFLLKAFDVIHDQNISNEDYNNISKAIQSIEKAATKTKNGRAKGSDGSGIDAIYDKVTQLIYKYINNELKSYVHWKNEPCFIIT